MIPARKRPPRTFNLDRCMFIIPFKNLYQIGLRTGAKVAALSG
jgi:hypothetical protein